MKYIKRLILENFQSHKYSEVDFDPGLNVIVGPSDTGKSAVIRALKWVLYNEPAGDFFIREGETSASVTIHISDGTILQRYRTKSKNGYLLVKSDGEEMRFEGFGKDVPEEITDITNIRKILLDRDESSAINLGEQLEGPFLLSEKTSVRANAIGRLVGVNIIDDALTDVLKDMKNLNSNRKNTEKRVEGLKNEITGYDFLDSLKLKLDRLNQINKDIKNKDSILKSVEESREKYTEIIRQIKNNEELLSKLKQVDRLEWRIKDLEINILKYKKLNELSESYIKNRKDFIYNNEINNKLLSIGMVNEALLSIGDKLIKYNDLTKANNKYNNTKIEHDQLIKKLEGILKVVVYEEKIVIGKEKNQLLVKLSNARTNYFDTKTRIKSGLAYMEKIIKFVSIDEKVINADINSIKLQKLNMIKKNYTHLKSEIAKVELELEKNNNENHTLTNKYKDILISIEKCPFCYSDITTESIDNIIKNHIGG